jgi:hypothetical protein
MVFYINLVAVFLALITGCGQETATNSQNQMSNEINIEAKIIKFIPNAMRDNMDDGSLVVYDGTELLITSPAELKDKTLMVYHQKPMDPSSLWVEENAKLSFRVQRILIENNYLIFTSGIQDLKRL